MGWRALVTNASGQRLTLTGSVLTYREGGSLERPFHQIKDKPLGIRPLFVKLPEQVLGLTRLLLIALRVLTLVEIVLRAVVVHVVGYCECRQSPSPRRQGSVGTNGDQYSPARLCSCAVSPLVLGWRHVGLGDFPALLSLASTPATRPAHPGACRPFAFASTSSVGVLWVLSLNFRLPTAAATEPALPRTSSPPLRAKSCTPTDLADSRWRSPSTSAHKTACPLRFASLA